MSVSATFLEARKRDEVALDFWFACERAAAWEREGLVRLCTDCWHNDSCSPSRYCPSCREEA
jgi:hypothetical protein